MSFNAYIFIINIYIQFDIRLYKHYEICSCCKVRLKYERGIERRRHGIGFNPDTLKHTNTHTQIHFYINAHTHTHAIGRER